MAETPTLRERIFDVVLVLVFMVGLCLPLVTMVLLPDKQLSQHENRALAQFSQVNWESGDLHVMAQQFERYFRDQFGFRDTLIRQYHTIMATRFGILGSPYVIEGEGGWLFYTRNLLLEDFQGRVLLEEPHFQQWYEEQNRRNRWLQKRGIEYLSFASPNKQSIYPEMMPPQYRLSRGQSRLDQLHQYISNNPADYYVDLRYGMIRAKKYGVLYHKSDSHWNDLGAHAAFRTLLGQFRKRFPEIRFNTDFGFREKKRSITGGDLARMLMTREKYREWVPQRRKREYCATRMELPVSLSSIGEQGHEQPIYMRCKAGVLRAVVFSDSFIDRVLPYLSENFAEIVYLHKDYDQRNVEEIMKLFTPDIVIEERVERNYFRQILEN